jgi:hypothetical protein
MISIDSQERSRIASGECGAALVGGSEGQLFEAAQLHLAHHHPELLGALEFRVITQMAKGR